MTSVIIPAASSSELPANWVQPLQVPQSYNGYVTVARPALRLTAAEVQVGDILMAEGYIFRVDRIDQLELQYHGMVVKFCGTFNAVRFPHETVSVIRPDVAQEH